jgi:hypothetical protein
MLAGLSTMVARHHDIVARHHRHDTELIDVEARIATGEKLIAEQKARIAWLRERGWDTEVSIQLLAQLELSQRLLTSTGNRIRREMKALRRRALGPAWHENA